MRTTTYLMKTFLATRTFSQQYGLIRAVRELIDKTVELSASINQYCSVKYGSEVVLDTKKSMSIKKIVSDAVGKSSTRRFRYRVPFVIWSREATVDHGQRSH